ncbi:hypothetical protein TorRG33x02_070280 [Trema orientale]|uniref:Uncharacterized protein n=1 Tax=Trema orientale TaxID=63057 RepID=A0A2P5FHN2_TREOI|nr:hypothetical protein TorRG33x02_070280 [Trema orientale]
MVTLDQAAPASGGKITEKAKQERERESWVSGREYGFRISLRSLFHCKARYQIKVPQLPDDEESLPRNLSSPSPPLPPPSSPSPPPPPLNLSSSQPLKNPIQF